MPLPCKLNVVFKSQSNDCLSVNKKIVLAWVPSHVGMMVNEKADELAKQELNF